MSGDASAAPGGLSGRWRDERLDGRGRVVWAGEWRSNLVVAGCNRLLAALMRREPGISGIRYWAFGTGEEGWDALLPGPRPADTRLAAEVARLELAPEQVVYLDAAGSPAAAPTERLEVAAVLRGSDFTRPVRLREFGLFGGDATDAPNSGLLVNRVIHPRIDLGPGDTLRRTVRLTFAGGGLAADRPGDPVGGGGLTGGGVSALASGLAAGEGSASRGPAGLLPVESLDGVGRVYAGELVAAGIATVRQLADADPQRSVGSVPPARLRELRAKARLVVGLRPDPAILAPLADRRLGSLLAARPEELAGALGGLAAATRTVVYLHGHLSTLEVALDAAWLQKLRVRDLAPL